MDWKKRFTKDFKILPGYYWSEKYQTFITKEMEALLEAQSKSEEIKDEAWAKSKDAEETAK
jgi:hypothetical protein